MGDVVIIGQDSDGTDGPTDFAGGIVDNFTAERARKLGIDIYAALNRHDVTPVLLQLEDAITHRGHRHQRERPEADAGHARVTTESLKESFMAPRHPDGAAAETKGRQT
ncbi:MAG: hypothetical protein MZU91_02630 [Desulfosudis oleivorans]|nr:hypothetical protein [Desulfosudis oleivorans]